MLTHQKVDRGTLCCRSHLPVSIRRGSEVEAGKMGSSTSSQADDSDSSTSSQADDSGYGNIMDIQTSGASWQTSQQDNLGFSGVMASHAMAQEDAGRMENYRSEINTVGSEYGIDPALIAAIISRESRAGNTLHYGKGDYDPVRRAYNAWGLMQVDVNPKGGNHTPQGAWDSEQHLRHATGILVGFIEVMQDKFSGLSKEKQLKGGIAAYNMGDGNVHSYEYVDENTTGKDYSNDVVARAQWYKTHGGF